MILEPPKIKSSTFFIVSPSICHCNQHTRRKLFPGNAPTKASQHKCQIVEFRELERASPVDQGVKNLPAMQEIQEMQVLSWVRRSPGGGHGNPLQYSCLENSMDRGAWQSTVHGVTKSQKRLKWQHARTQEARESRTVLGYLKSSTTPPKKNKSLDPGSLKWRVLPFAKWWTKQIANKTSCA